MSKLRTVDADKIVKTLARIGFQILKQHDIHLILKHPDGRLTVVPSIKERRLQ